MTDYIATIGYILVGVATLATLVAIIRADPDDWGEMVKGNPAFALLVLGFWPLAWLGAGASLVAHLATPKAKR
jgi:hypothetical protein